MRRAAFDAARPSAPEPGEQWAGPSRRARAIAVALALALAALTFLVVNGVWRGAAPLKPTPARAVEVRIVPTLPTPGTTPSAPSR